MISNPQRLCLIHERKNVLFLMKYCLGMERKDRALGHEWHTILLDLGKTSKRLHEEIKRLPEMVDEKDVDEVWFTRVKYIDDNYGKTIKAATDSLV